MTRFVGTDSHGTRLTEETAIQRYRAVTVIGPAGSKVGPVAPVITVHGPPPAEASHRYVIVPVPDPSWPLVKADGSPLYHIV